MRQPGWRRLGPLIVSLTLLGLRAALSQEGPRDLGGYLLVPISGADGGFATVRSDGKAAWRGLEVGKGHYPPYMYFRVPDTVPAVRGPAYVEVDYKDLGTGRLSIQYNASHPEEDYRRAGRGFGRFLTDRGTSRTAVFELTDPAFRRGQNLGADLRLCGTGKAPLHVLVARLYVRPTPLFRERAARPWLEPYTGPRRSDIDATTLHKKVLCGYQGWFRCPGDDDEAGWVHWSRDPDRIAPGTLTFEMWPDLSDFSDPEKYPAPGFTHPDGRQAYLFSSADPRTVERHFDWMRRYGIDGVFVQRFLVDLDDPARAARVLGFARAAANRTGRVFAVDYDMTGASPDRTLDLLAKDWRWLVDDMKITADPRYLHHDGRPVVRVFGFYRDRIGPQLAHRIIDFFKANGKYRATLIGSGPWDWREEADPEWARAFRRFDAICPWNVGNVSADHLGRRHATTEPWGRDLVEAKRAGMLYLPVVYPGFGWDQMKGKPPGTTAIPRLGGQFLWEQFATAARLHIDMAFVAMFDEVDEGTAIFKVTNAPPVQGHFATFEGQPADWYLRLTGEGSRMIRGERTVTATISIPP